MPEPVAMALFRGQASGLFDLRHARP